MWNVAVWLNQIETSPPPPPSTKRKWVDSDAAPAPAPVKRRRGLAPLDPNAQNGKVARKSPAKIKMPPSTRRGRGKPRGDQEEEREGAMDETPRPQPRSRNLPAVGSGVTGTRDIRFDLNPPLWLPGRSAQVDADADIASASASTSATSASAASRTSRPASPSKDRLRDAVDLQLADFPIYIRKAGEGHLPYCVQALLTDLEEIEEGDKLVPRCIAPLLEQHRAGERALRPRYIDDDPVTDQEEAQLTRDLEALVAVMGIAREVERDESTEAAWNSEVHSPMLLICLRRWSDRVRHFNITRAQPLKDFLPTRSALPTETRLVDYSINILPQPDVELRTINRHLQRQPTRLASITQTITTAVRGRPCILSIETKTDSGYLKAKNQLTVWGYAHFRRLASFLPPQSRPAGDEEEESVLQVHPMIHVQGHEWKLHLLLERRGGKEYEMVEMEGVLGSTGTIMGLWKLRASLGRLVRWGIDEWWSEFWTRLQDGEETGVENGRTAS